MLPDYFQNKGGQIPAGKKGESVHVAQNTHDGFDFYQSLKPIKSESSRTQEELEKSQEEINKLRKKVKDLQQKLQKIDSGALQAVGGDGGAAAAGKGGAGGGVDGGGELSKGDNVQFEKRCTNDKVIQNITELVQKNARQKEESSKLFQERQKELKNMNSEVESIKAQLAELAANEQENLGKIDQEIAGKQQTAGSGAEAKQELKRLQKQKDTERKDIKRMNEARRTLYHDQMRQKE